MNFAPWRRSARLGILIFAALLATVGPAHAADWPSRPITLVVPFPAGGPTDAVARAVAQELSASLGQPMVVDNRVGASGTIGYGAVAQAAPDGHTLLVGTATMATSPHLYKQLKFDPRKDLTAVAMLGTTPVFIWVADNFPARTLPELLTLVRAKPGVYNYSSSAPATLAHLGSLVFFERAGAKLTHLGYKGSSQAMTDLLGGVFSIHFEVAQPVAPHLSAGKVRPLAVLAQQRSKLMPNVPSVAELGWPGIEAVPFMVLMAPAGTPQPIVDRLNEEVRRALQAPTVRTKLERVYFEAADGGKPAELGPWLTRESARWGEVIRSHDLKVE